MKCILGCNDVQIPECLMTSKENVLGISIKSDELDKVYNDIILLWQDKSVKEAFNNRKKLEIEIPSTTSYIFDNVERFARTNYSPSSEDIENIDLPVPNGVWEMSFSSAKRDYEIVFVNVGQWSSERKWIHQFDDIAALIFFCNIAEYDHVTESPKTSLNESLSLFSTLADFFDQKLIYLWFTHVEEFEDKLKKKPLQQFFPAFSPSDEDSNLEYIFDLFKDCSKQSYLVMKKADFTKSHIKTFLHSLDNSFGPQEID